MEQVDGALRDLGAVTLADPTGAMCPLHREDRFTLVVIATPEAGERAYALGAAVREAIDGGRLAITLVVDLSAVPRLARAVLRHHLEAARDDILSWLADAGDRTDDGTDPWAALALLADWDGGVTRQLGFERGQAAPLFLVAGPDGGVLAGGVPEEADDLLAMVFDVLEDAA